MSNRTAFLDTISKSEGTYGKGDNGYNIIVGGGLFQSYADHPRQKILLPKLGIYSTAAGRYQILARNYDAYKARLGLADFSPASQDAIALQLIRERKALDLVDSGCFDNAIALCANIWASFPGAGYGQRENKMADLRTFYLSVGGKLNDGGVDV